MVRYTYLCNDLNLYLGFEYYVDSLIGGQKKKSNASYIITLSMGRNLSVFFFFKLTYVCPY